MLAHKLVSFFICSKSLAIFTFVCARMRMCRRGRERHSLHVEVRGNLQELGLSFNHVAF